MARFLIDENLPRQLCSVLLRAGHECEHALDLGLRGRSDEQVLAAAQQLRSILISRDNDFSDVHQISVHHGIIVVRYPSEVSIERVITDVADLISRLQRGDFAGWLVILEPGRVRMRKPISG